MNKKSIRQQLILKNVNERSFITVDELCKMLNVSKITVRRDLADMEARGLLVRKVGGAISNSKAYYALDEDLSSPRANDFDLLEPNKATLEEILKINGILTLNEQELEEESEEAVAPPRTAEELRDISKRCKIAIAKQAASLIHPNHRIGIDSGSTTAEIVNFLGKTERVLVMTNSLSIGYAISKLPEPRRPSLILTGGLFDSQSDSLYTKHMVPVLKEYSLDLCFVGADGFNERGTTTKFEAPSFTRAMSQISRFTIVLIESSKITNRQPNDELSWQNIDLVITDSLIPMKVRKSLMKMVDVIAAQVDDI